METIKISKIIIPDEFRNSLPNKNKVMYVRQYVELHGKLDNPVVLNGQILVNGYIRYLVAAEKKMHEIPFVNTLDYKRVYPYIAGKFKHEGKEYIWKNGKGIPVSTGDRVLVNSKNRTTGKNYGIVVVTRVFESDAPSMLRHKSVIKKIELNDL